MIDIFGRLEEVFRTTSYVRSTIGFFFFFFFFFFLILLAFDTGGYKTLDNISNHRDNAR